MIYNNTQQAFFISRPNRFIANCVLSSGETIICHVKNTGRCKELLIPGVKVIVQKSENPLRKTKYDLISVYKGDMLINMDSQAPNRVFAEHIPYRFQDIKSIKPEYTIGNSRIDFLIEAKKHKILAEVKGVTLEENGVCLFPDAPTERGIKHLNELIHAVKSGFDTYAVFVIQMMPVKFFSPNYSTQPAFGEALKTAQKSGVKLIAFQCKVSESSIEYHSDIPVIL